MKIEALIGSIIMVVLGVLIVCYWNQLGNAMVESQKTFFQKLGSDYNIGNSYKIFAKIFILICGIIFTLAGTYGIIYTLMQN